MLRTLFTILTITALQGILAAQSVDSVENQKRKQPLTHNYFVQFEGQVTNFLNNGAMMAGATAAWIFNDRYTVSAKYSLLTTVEDPRKWINPDSKDTFQLRFQSAMLGGGYVLLPHRKFSVHPELYGGWGMLRVQYPNDELSKHHFGLIQPSISGVWNVSEFFRMGVGANFRAAIGNFPGYLRSVHISGAAGTFFIRVGRF